MLRRGPTFYTSERAPCRRVWVAYPSLLLTASLCYFHASRNAHAHLHCVVHSASDLYQIASTRLGISPISPPNTLNSINATRSPIIQRCSILNRVSFLQCLTIGLADGSAPVLVRAFTIVSRPPSIQRADQGPTHQNHAFPGPPPYPTRASFSR
ncbi:hypothetical protein OH76DRAFT_1023990 [Lentinus brumalis]|uniref:Uncharacterized protein n=1 Tax=Lentinus brumalis TaxID=2498619 RepID=A0A371CXL0_9APHY|nr:hypothetical protein OH76DRAFT_1023990 [Polyporus brumalis]